jgi:hypothetical protein
MLLGVILFLQLFVTYKPVFIHHLFKAAADRNSPPAIKEQAK